MATTTDYFTTKTVNGQSVNYSFEVVNMQQMLNDVNDLSSINNSLITQNIATQVSTVNNTVTNTATSLNSVIDSLITYAEGGTLVNLNTDLAPLVNQ